MESRDSVTNALQLNALGLAGATMLGGTAYALTRPEPAIAGACDGAGEPIRSAWDEHARARVEGALIDSEAPYAAATWKTVESMLSTYTDDWARAAEAQCSAQLVESADTTTLDRRELCLTSHRRAFEEIVEVLASNEEGVAQQAVQGVATLPPVDACADPRRLEAFSTARDPEAIAALSEARTDLARARARGGMGQYDQALALADQVIDAGRKYDDPSTEASGLLLRGQYAERKGNVVAAEKDLRDAVRLSEIAHDHTTRALALIRLIYVVGADANRHEEALTLGGDAGAVLRMLGSDPLLQAGLDMNLGAADRVAREFDDALVHYQAALDAYSKMFGEAHPETGRALTNLGGLYISRGEPDKAIEVLLRAKQSFIATLGAEHPFVPVVLSNLGTAYKTQGDTNRALGTLEEALSLRKKADGPTHPGVAKTLFNLGAAQFEARRYEDAIASLTEGRTILLDAKTEDPDRIGRYTLMIGASQLNLGRLEEARESLKPLLEVFPISRGADGRFARRTRLFLSIAMIPEDLRRARTLAELARESAADDDSEVDSLEFVLWICATIEHGPDGI